MGRKPIVSILIPNYNYGRYLRECLDSVLDQVYKNFEVIFCDNNSSDNSYEIALNYIDKFRTLGIHYEVIKNSKNIGSYKNSLKCISKAKGDYVIFLSSDDFLDKCFIQKTLNLVSNYDVGMVMTHRNEVDEKGNIKKILPFYNRSCIIKGEKQAAVHMMAGIAVPSQCLINTKLIKEIMKERISYKVAGDWYFNFNIACRANVGYIKEPLCNYRVHSDNETSQSERKLIGIFEHYQLINEFVDIAKEYGYEEVIGRYDIAVKKLGDMCLRYALKMFKNNYVKIAKKYLQLAPVFKETIVLDEMYMKMISWINMTHEEVMYEVDKIENLERKVSYDPPEGSIYLEGVD